MASAVPDDAPKPRLCHVKKTDDFNGYGFNLHAEKGKAGQYIGKVDPGSPAEKAKLKQGDRIVEVNGTNISNENHQQVVQRIKAVADETKMLVVDHDTDDYYKSKKIVIRGDMPNVQFCSNVENDDPEGATESRLAGLADKRSSKASSNMSDDAPKPRLCHLKIWPDFSGYGFNLHAEKGKPGQFIGNIDTNSPAELAGLKEGDRIVEVNGENVGRDNHGEVVKKIKSDPTQTRMLVVDAEAEKYYKERDITVSSSMSNVETIVCPDNKPSVNGLDNQIEAEVNHTTEVSQTEHDNEANERAEEAEAITESIKEVEKAVEDGSSSEDEKQENNNNTDLAEDYDVIANVPKPEEEDKEEVRAPTPEPVKEPEPEPVRVPTPEPVRVPTPEPEKPKKEEPPKKSPAKDDKMGFAVSAKEAREKMSKKRRDEVKMQQISAKDKYNLYMKL